jgi:hypothetical protein
VINERRKMAGQVVQQKSIRSASAESRKKHGRSRLTNARALLLDQVDGRSALYRRYRDVANQILADQGGIEQCSESRKHLIRRFAAAAVLAEQLEARIVNGESVDVSEFAQLASTLVRITNHLGLERIPRVVNGLVSEVIDGNVDLPDRPSWSSGLRDRLAAAAEKEPT